jgi:IS30 family transposase
LSDDEREQIGLAKAVGHSIGAIPQAVARPKSTIWRELSRNRLPSGRYSPLHAAGAYQKNFSRALEKTHGKALSAAIPASSSEAEFATSASSSCQANAE